EEYSQVPEGHYLLLGDNSAHSRDGRWFGWVPNEHLVGRVACIWWPPPRWRDFTGFSETLWWRVSAGLIVLLTLVRLVVGRIVSAPTADGKERWRFALALAYGFRVPLSRLWLLRWARPEKGDLVLASVAADKGQEASFTGWVAAMPGERVVLEEGRLTVNGRERPLPAVVLEALTAEDAAVAPYGRLRTPEHAQVPEGHYFILAPVKAGEKGDSRTLGWVAERDIVGRVGGAAAGAEE
ncbi:MAG TPA: signal peptidase I, partial [Candidatus Hydrogenedentes bacterium]|nr:signal peptidase I [Candidatus Hydrogenedentota bacterium]